MSKLTRVVAWSHIVIYGITLFLVSAMLGGGSAVVAELNALMAEFSTEGIKLVLPLAHGMAPAVVIVLGVFLLWISLLRKQVWAWWGLIVLLTLGIADMIISRMPTDYQWLNKVVQEAPRASLGFLQLLAALFLLLDPPWGWRSKRSGTRRRRKKSRSTSSSSSSTTKSRRRRRRST